MKKLLFTIMLLFLVSCAGVAKFKPMDCYAPVLPEVLPVDLLDGVIQGESKDNVLKNWGNLLFYIDELKTKCGILDAKEVAAILQIPQSEANKLIRYAVKDSKTKKYFLEK